MFRKTTLNRQQTGIPLIAFSTVAGLHFKLESKKTLSTTQSLRRGLNYLARNLFYVLDVNTLAQDKLFRLDLVGNIPNCFVDAKTIFRFAQTSFSVYNSDVIKFIRKGF